MKKYRGAVGGQSIPLASVETNPWPGPARSLRRSVPGSAASRMAVSVALFQDKELDIFGQITMSVAGRPFRHKDALAGNMQCHATCNECVA
jgi:hypothetical protein